MLEEKMKKPAVISGAVIFLCFLLTSTGWLAWNSHMREYMEQKSVNVCTMVAGYALQAVGIGLFALILRYKKSPAYKALPALTFFHYVFLIPAVTCTDAAGIAAGLVMGLFCGLIAGYYLSHLSRNVPLTQRARVFGFAYGLSILASWLLAETGGSSFYTSKKLLLVCAVLTAVIIFIVKKSAGDNQENAEESGRAVNEGAYGSAEIGEPQIVEVVLKGVLVLLLGIGIGCGFTFVPPNVGETVNLELSRLVYAFSLVIAGAVTDRSRKNGAVLALTVLVFPFVMLCLKQEPIPAVVFWMLSYFAFGFYSVYRIILYSDLNILYLSGFGLMIGRIGDAAGEVISLALYERPVVHVGVVAVISVAAIFVFFQLYHVLYIPGEVQTNGAKADGVGDSAAAVNETGVNAAQANEAGFDTTQEPAAATEAGLNVTRDSAAPANGVMVNNVNAPADAPDREETARAPETSRADRTIEQEDRFYRFSAQYELSQRERDILRLILSEKKNYEIADTLYISENTVKFHVRNILKKTDCRNRNELVLLYAANA